MNQKYLKAASSGMSGPGDAVFFEATPENIAAFLAQHQWAARSAIVTTDERAFLTACMGFIDVCLDQEFLVQKLLPIYTKIQMGEIPAPPLKTVAKETALAEKCLRPDWNYLRWEGYSDKKYQDICSGEALLELPWYGETVSVELQVRSYYNASQMALMLVDWSDGEPEYWGDLTVHLGVATEKNCAFVDVNDLGESILTWIEKNGLGKSTGRSRRSGFVTYPEYRFDPKRLLELDDYGYQEHSRRYDIVNKPRQQRKQDGQER